MRGMNSNCIDLIYLDPPFNSKANYAAPIGSMAAGAEFKDTWTLSDVDIAWLDLLEAKHSGLNRVIHAAMTNSDKSYLVYMAVRLLEMKRILKPTGSIYLHCDPTMSHYLKLVMDAIFGRKGFRNNIVWKRIIAGKQSQHKDKKYSSNSDHILFYAKSEHSDLTPFRKMTDYEILEKFPLIDESGNRYYDDSGHIFRPNALGSRPNLCYEWRGFRNPNPSGWTLSKKRLEEEYQKGNFVILDNGKLQRRKFLKDHRGIKLSDLWDDIKIATGRERTTYPTQKPLALLERIIKASSNKGDIVFDPFCGCATTLVAADRLQRNWAGIDISPKAVELVTTRIKQDQGLFQEITARKAIPERTDVIQLKPYNSIDNKKFLYGEQEGHCKGCGTHFEMRNLTIDHIIARSVGGTDHLDNLQLLCGNCNSIKGNRGQEYLLAKIEGRKVAYAG